MTQIVQPLPLAKLAYQRLRQAILNGQLKQGEIYNEMTLAKEMGVSRTPVREALLELASQGFVTFLPRRGVQVNIFSYEDAEEFFELREVIELAVVEKVTRRHDEIDLGPLEAALAATKKFAAKRDKNAFLNADRSFHMELGKLAGNRRMLTVLENLRDMIAFLGAEALGKPERLEEVLVEHDDIMEAIRVGDVEAAVRAMDHHLQTTRSTVLQRHQFGAPHKS